MLSMLTFSPGFEILFVRGDSPRAIERKAQNMTDLMRALCTAVDRLEAVEDILERLSRLETLLHELGTSVARTDDRVGMLESGDSSEDLDDRVGAILDRKLDLLIEDAVTEALSGREITICL